MKTDYESVELEVITFENNDVIVTSECPNEDWGPHV